MALHTYIRSHNCKNLTNFLGCRIEYYVHLILKAGDFPHLLIYGPSGAGKKTRIHCILRELYGSGVEHMSVSMKNFEAPSGKKLEIQTVSSNYHIQLSPGLVRLCHLLESVFLRLRVLNIPWRSSRLRDCPGYPESTWCALRLTKMWLFSVVKWRWCNVNA